jgi:hypothetical protein
VVGDAETPADPTNDAARVRSGSILRRRLL